jgi:hypothetical protein
MTIKRKLLTIAVAPVVVAVIVAVINMLASRQAEQAMQISAAADEVTLSIVELNMLTHEYLRRQSERPRRQWRSRHASLTRLLADATATGDTDAILTRLRDNLADVRRLFEEISAPQETAANGTGPPASTA